MGFPLEFIPAKAGAGMTGWEILGIKSFTFYPIGIAQIDKQNPAMVADPVNPARQAGRFANLGLTELLHLWVR